MYRHIFTGTYCFGGGAIQFFIFFYLSSFSQMSLIVESALAHSRTIITKSEVIVWFPPAECLWRGKWSILHRLYLITLVKNLQLLLLPGSLRVLRLEDHVEASRILLSGQLGLSRFLDSLRFAEVVHVWVLWIELLLELFNTPLRCILSLRCFFLKIVKIQKSLSHYHRWKSRNGPFIPTQICSQFFKYTRRYNANAKPNIWILSGLKKEKNLWRRLREESRCPYHLRWVFGARPLAKCSSGTRGASFCATFFVWLSVNLWKLILTGMGGSAAR